MLDLTPPKKPPLNTGQQLASDEFFKFLLNDEPEMKISAPGGYGKTFLMGELIDTTMPQYFDICELMGQQPQYVNVDMTALTNKAAEVLSLATGRHTSTVQSYFNLKVQDDYDTGVSKIAKTNNWYVHENKILFVDEYTMTDTPLDRIIKEGTHNCKIVWVGDHCQMAPVMEAISPIDKRQMPTAYLTEPMRNTDPRMLAVLNQLRETIESGIRTGIPVFKPIPIIPGLIDHLDNNQMQAMLAHTFPQQTLNSRVLCYTNKKVVAYNDYIRDLRGLPHEYTVNELLVNNSAIRLKNSMLHVEEEVEIINLGREEDIHIADTVMKIRKADIKTRLGVIFTDVKLPSDRNHFASLLSYFKKLRNWPQYYALKNFYPDLRQRDAATVYKSQGSTYDTVFIDLGDISTCHNPMQVARMLYVALSRMRERIFLFGDLASKYGGLKT